jgi:hypothetical protein
MIYGRSLIPVPDPPTTSLRNLNIFLDPQNENSNLINAYSYESMLLFASKTRMNDMYEISRSIIRMNVQVQRMNEVSFGFSRTLNFLFFFVITER